MGAAKPARERAGAFAKERGPELRGDAGPAGGGGALGLSVGCRSGAGPSWQREVLGSWPQNAREPQKPNFWAEVVLPAEGRVSVLGMAGWAGGFHASGPGMAIPLPRPGFVLKPRGGKAGPLARPVELGERGTNVDGARGWGRPWGGTSAYTFGEGWVSSKEGPGRQKASRGSSESDLPPRPPFASPPSPMGALCSRPL